MQRFLTTNHFAGSDREQLNWLMGFAPEHEACSSPQ